MELYTMNDWLKQVKCNVKTIFGLPNYEKYVEYHNRKHHNEPLMSEKEYYVFALKERYESGKVNRCC